jgi:putative thioredoxin
MVLEVANFQNEVLVASRLHPVLVDFWAPWCGPCRMLGPVLEKLADSNGGAWTLAKLNTDENQEIARKYRISSIPAVKLFVDGEVTDEFIGALPEASVRQWLSRAMPSPMKARLNEAKSLVESGASAEASAALDEVLREDLDNAEALILKARLMLFDDPEGAIALLTKAEVVDARLVQMRLAVYILARAIALRRSPDELGESPGRDAYLAALAALSRQDYVSAFDGFIDVVRRDRTLDDDGARNACLALFNLLGENSDLTRQYRRTLQMALF